MPKTPSPTRKIASLRDAPIYQIAFGANSTLSQHAKRIGVSTQTLASWLAKIWPIPEDKKHLVKDILRKQAEASNTLFRELFSDDEIPLINAAPLNRHNARANQGNGSLSKPL